MVWLILKPLLADGRNLEKIGNAKMHDALLLLVLLFPPLSSFISTVIYIC